MVDNQTFHGSTVDKEADPPPSYDLVTSTNKVAPEEDGTVKHFEDILDDLGAFGHWQRVLFILISLADIHGAFVMLSPVFLTDTPEWTCTKAGDVDNVTLANQSMQCQYGPDESIQCTEFLFHGDYTSIISEWGLVCGEDYVGDLITTLQFVGLIIGAGLCGQLSDLMGRKKTYFLVFFFMLTATLVSAFANSWQLYAACRLVIGLGFGGLMVVACVYPMEFVGKRWRVFCGTIGFWALGIMVLAPMAYWLREWRHLTLAIGASGYPYFVLWFVIPESPRWLIEHERYEEALSILETIAKRNGRPPPSIEDLRRLRQLDIDEAQVQKAYTYLDIFRTWDMAKRSVIMALAWFTAFTIYYEITYNLKNLSGDRYINMVLSGTVDLVAMLSVIVLLSILGRRKALLFYISLTMVCLVTILVVILTGNEISLEDLILGSALVGKAAALSGTYNVQIYTAELFPTVVRNLGVGVGSISGRIGGALAPQIVYLGTYFTAAPYIICAVLAAAVIPLCFLLPETLGRPLQDKLVHQDRIIVNKNTAVTAL